MVKTILYVIIGVLEGIAHCIPLIIQASVDHVQCLLEDFANTAEVLIAALFNMNITFINGLSDAIRKNTPLLIEAVDNLMRAIIDDMGIWLEHFLGFGVDLITNIVYGIFNVAGTLSHQWLI
jgi:hypothetical protein